MIRHRVQTIFDIFVAAIGLRSGYLLSEYGNFEVFKLLNILGISFDIFGVVILSYVITSNAAIKRFVSGWVASIAISMLAFIPINMFLGAMIGSLFFGHEEVDNLFRFFVPVTLFSLFSVFFLEDTVLLPKMKRFQSEDVRVKTLGGFFLIAGLIIQLCAAVLDFLA